MKNMTMLIAVSVVVCIVVLVYVEMESEGVEQQSDQNGVRLYSSEANLGVASNPESEIVLFDESWTMINDSDYVDGIIQDYVNNGTPVIMTGNEDYMSTRSELKSNVTVDVENVVARAYYVADSGIGHQFIVIGEDKEAAIEKAIEWAEQTSTSSFEINEPVVIMPNSEEPAEVQVLDVITVTMELSTRGDFSLTAIISKINGILDPDHDYYTVHFYQFGAPNTDDNYRLADLEMSAVVIGGELLNSGPNSTSGTTTTSVDLGAGIGVDSDGLSGSMNASLGWSYSISDVTVSNSTVTGEGGNANIHHDVNEAGTTGMGYRAEPGIMINKDKDSSYVRVVSHNYINTCVKVEKLFGLYDSYENYLNLWVGVEYSIWNTGTYGYQIGLW